MQGGVGSMKSINSGWRPWAVLLLAVFIMIISGSTVSLAAWFTSSLDVQLTCTEEFDKCWHAHSMNAENSEQVMDTCWREAKECPKECKDHYFTLREAGMEAGAAEDRVLFSTPPCSKAAVQEKWLDLMPVVIDADQGKIEVRNTGTAASEASQIAVVCSVSLSGKSTPCGGRHSGFDIPTLQPGGSYSINLFGAGAIPRKKGTYTIKITVDPYNRIAEINEANNVVSLVLEDATEKMLALKEMQAGRLKLNALVDGHKKADKYFYRYASVTITSASTFKSVEPLPGSMGSYVTVLPSGTYDVLIHEHAWGNPDTHLTVKIADGQTVEKTITTREPGELQLITRWKTSKFHDSACAVIRPVAITGAIALYAYLSVTNSSADLSKKDKNTINCDPYIDPVIVTFTRLDEDRRTSNPMKVPAGFFGSDTKVTTFGLLPGTYRVSLWPENHKELQQTLENIRIEPGKALLKNLEFDPPAEKK